MAPKSDHPAFIVGLPRSGTKLLRDTLHHHPEINTQPYALNHIWNRNQHSAEHDQYSPASVTEKQRQAIRTEFQRLYPSGFIPLEKNTHHSLRMDFVARIFPRAYFIYLVRDPIDTITSMMNRWKSPFDWSYLFRGTVWSWSPTDFNRQALSGLARTILAAVSGKNRVSLWGPHFPNMEEVFESRSLFEGCTIQWCRCLNGILDFRENGHDENMLEIRYERLLRSPESTLASLVEFLDIGLNDRMLSFADRIYSTKSIGRGYQELTEEERGRLLNRVEPLLARTGFRKEGLNPGERDRA